MKSLLFLVLMVAMFFLGRYLYFKPNVSSGQRLSLPDITMMDGKTVGRKAFRGNLLLVDFWGSWCGPCRKEAPSLVALFDKYEEVDFGKAGKFKILSVGVETNEKGWKRAIERDGLRWDWHTTSLKSFEEPLAIDFGVKQIPSKFLLNEEGLLVLSNPTFGEIEEYLNSRK